MTELQLQVERGMSFYLASNQFSTLVIKLLCKGILPRVDSVLQKGNMHSDIGAKTHLTDLSKGMFLRLVNALAITVGLNECA